MRVLGDRSDRACDRSVGPEAQDVVGTRR
jgi:hypothetical protein